MAEIYPFRSLHYNLKKIPDLAKTVTQPYDKITPEMQARYYDLSPYNLVRIIRGRENAGDTPNHNVYTRAARSLQDWIQQGILTSESEPALYPYYQEYAVPGEGRSKKLRRGVVALCRLEDYSRGVVHRHEETLSAPKADRLELLKATRAHCGQIFMLYSDPAAATEKQLEGFAQNKPWECVEDEYGTRHTVWRITDPLAVEKVVTGMRDKKLVIADGHHRYETALAYRDHCRAQSLPDDRAEYVMATFIRMESTGLTLLPTHRVVHTLPDFDWVRFASAAQNVFDWEEFPVRGRSRQWGRSIVARLREAGRERPSLAVFARKHDPVLLRLREDKDIDLDGALEGVPAGLRRLDVVLLHLLLEGALGIDRQSVREEKNLRYVREFATALEEVENGKAQLCFLLNPTPIQAVWSNALAGHPLPQKSTDFYPKLLSGLTVYWLDNPAGL
jgi:uncharacterized protein (DUF1015 family)